MAREVGSFHATGRAKIDFAVYFASAFVLLWTVFVIATPFPEPDWVARISLFALASPVGWFVLVSRLNRWSLVLTDGRISLRHGPLPSPWTENIELIVREVRAFRHVGRALIAELEFDGSHANRQKVLKRRLPPRVAEYLAERLNAHLDAKREG